MLDQLKRMAVLATVVDCGSFVAAARQLKTTTSAVSQQVRALERDMGVTLLHRSTRKLSLTPAGRRFHEGCAAMLAAAQQAQQQLLQLRDAPEGELRIAAPVGFARHLGPALAALMQAHPALSLHLEVEDGFTDLVDKRIDLAVRFGRLPDSSWVAQRIAEKAMALFAAPAYLARRGVPAELADLHQHDWLALRPGTDHVHLLPLQLAGEQHLLRVSPRASSNNQLSLQQLCEAGLGLAMLSPDDVRDAQQAGRLLALLPGLQLPALPIHVLTPQRDAQPAKVRHAIAALRQYFAHLPQ
ncbi:LysR family transcriptional regulator [Paucibacter sp. APW11]|uniref:LysR family transcriptional regulator n=1 Tax=Roseateles aquae TaxID=3077235 RepID=A0ABU3PGM3_9BURK|nr:LysR family transcriptional regulator [Paucibacter sp. APW11]MDT9001735.1 LysR family transcriptional regulator [Paucibacter sp. APW11]